MHLFAPNFSKAAGCREATIEQERVKTFPLSGQDLGTDWLRWNAWSEAPAKDPVFVHPAFRERHFLNGP